MTPLQILISAIFALVLYGIAYYRGCSEGSRIGLELAAKAREELAEAQAALNCATHEAAAAQQETERLRAGLNDAIQKFEARQ